MRCGGNLPPVTTTNSGLRPNFIIAGSVVRWTSTKLNAMWGLKYEVGIHGFEGRQQSGVLGRPL
ncbi:hypothetical protein V1477_011767 [Vespula maculifrons]|uniref:Uncharacterized protein n=1 Tax=Vespula maculifrons TaxID=7453 RepID=A0ABD2C1T3_VESMC